MLAVHVEWRGTWSLTLVLLVRRSKRRFLCSGLPLIGPVKMGG